MGQDGLKVREPCSQAVEGTSPVSTERVLTVQNYILLTETPSLIEFQCVLGTSPLTFVLLKHPSRLLMQLTGCCILSHLFFFFGDPNSWFLFRSQLHISVWLQWQILFFLCSLKPYFFCGILSMYSSSLCLLALCPKCTWLYPLFSYVYPRFILSLKHFGVRPMHNVQKEQAWKKGWTLRRAGTYLKKDYTAF